MTLPGVSAHLRSGTLYGVTYIQYLTWTYFCCFGQSARTTFHVSTSPKNRVLSNVSAMDKIYTMQHRVLLQPSPNMNNRVRHHNYCSRAKSIVQDTHRIINEALGSCHAHLVKSHTQRIATNDNLHRPITNCLHAPPTVAWIPSTRWTRYTCLLSNINTENEINMST